jgi:acyl-CoA synthetase (AMP-forming)/AMP-acid ligase II
MQQPNALGRDTVWSTFYDIRRYGGLQILLRALLSGGSLVMSDPEEPIRDFLKRAAEAGVTHITGTPSHWRRVLMSRAPQLICPSYVRMSGEIADQPILDGLRAAYPTAVIAHAFASTEAGLAFDVTDGLAGFPEGFVGRYSADMEIRIEDGSMLIRSRRTATRYLNGDSNSLRREDGFVETHDLVEPRNGRYYFVGRRGGIINVGGQKCYPEEIESVINQHPMVHMSLVRARKNPLLGSVVVADVVLNAGADLVPSELARAAVSSEIMEACRRTLSAHKVPATIRIVASLEVAPSGKLLRPNA